jgi:hypothetical protein
MAVLAVLAQGDVADDGIHYPQVAAHALGAHHVVSFNLLLLDGAANGADRPQTKAANTEHRPDSGNHQERQLLSDLDIRKVVHSRLGASF